MAIAVAKIKRAQAFKKEVEWRKMDGRTKSSERGVGSRAKIFYPKPEEFMEEIADVAAMFDLTKIPEGSSPVERLLNEFEAHEAKEEKSLEYYREALQEMPNPMNRFLLQLIVSDEEKHRAVIHAMVATLKGSLTWTKPAGSLEGTGDLAVTDDKLLAVTEDFIQLEKEGIKEYKTLIKESSGYYHGLFKVLLDSMMRDSEKHVELLEFLRESLKAA
jgi:bacterioferritin (cytochrome b1)